MLALYNKAFIQECMNKKVTGTMFGNLSALPADPILGLLAKYRQDENPNKIDLGVGVYKDESGVTPILDCVKTAEKFRLDTEDTKVYIGPTGSASFNTEMTNLIFGEHKVISENLFVHVKPAQLFGLVTQHGQTILVYSQQPV